MLLYEGYSIPKLNTLNGIGSAALVIEVGIIVKYRYKYKRVSCDKSAS